MRAASSDQADRLLDGHEEAGHVRVRDGDRDAALELVAAPPAGASRGCRGRCRTGPAAAWCPSRGGPQDEHLGQPLGGPEHRGRVGGLVGGDQDEAVDLVLHRRLDQVHGAEHVRLDALAGVPLEHRQVLVGGRVEDDVRARSAKSCRIRSRSRMSAMISSSESSRARPSSSSWSRCRFDSSWSSRYSASGPKAAIWRHSSLPIEPPAAGDEHATAGHDRPRRHPDHPHLLPAEQAVDAQAAQVADADVALEGGDEGRQVADAGAGGRAGDGELADLGRGERRDGDDDHVDRRLLGDLGQFPGPTQHGDAGDGAPDGRRVVVEEPDRVQAELGSSPEVAGDRPPRLASTDDQAAETSRPARWSWRSAGVGQGVVLRSDGAGMRARRGCQAGDLGADAVDVVCRRASGAGAGRRCRRRPGRLRGTGWPPPRSRPLKYGWWCSGMKWTEQSMPRSEQSLDERVAFPAHGGVERDHVEMPGVPAVGRRGWRPQARDPGQPALVAGGAARPGAAATASRWRSWARPMAACRSVMLAFRPSTSTA